MKFTKSSRFTGSLFLVGLLALSGGCGYKTDPVPPQTVVPKAINDLRYTLDENGAKLTWTFPNETVGGKDLEEIEYFELYRAEIPIADYCSNCPIPFTEPEKIDGGITGIETRERKEHVSGMLRSGNKYFFKVNSRTSWWAASADSNIVTFVYHKPAAAPGGLKATAGTNRVSLEWSPVTTLVDDSPVDLPVTYQVYKSLDGQQYVPLGKLQKKNTFVDKDVKSGRTYYYKVESAMTFQKETVAGTRSTAVTSKVIDTQPPAQITGVTVVASATNFRIFWDASDASDLKGYRIYRRLDGESKPTKVGEVAATQTLYIDSGFTSEGKVYYSVSAFDKRNNESKRSKEATTRH